MRVVHLMCQLSMSSRCGTPTHVAELSAATAHAGSEVTVIAGRGADCHPARYLKQNDVELIEYDYRDLYSFAASLRRSRELMSGLASALVAVMGCLDRTRPTVLHVHDLVHGPWIGEVVNRHAPTPYLTTSHGADLEQSDGDPPSQRLLRSNLYGSHLIGVSSHMVAPLRTYAKGSQVGWIPGGVDIRKASRERRASGSPLQLLYAGRLDSEKGVLELPEILELARKLCGDVRMTVAGDGPLGDEVARLVSERALSGEVSFLGWVSQEEILALMRSADVLVCPTRWPEPFARVLLEASAAGLPVVTRDLGGNSEILGGSYGGLMAADAAPEDLARGVERLARSPSLSESMGRAARERVVRRFGWDGIAARYLDLYRECRERWPECGDGAVAG
jgi:glycosyltransferase involved in cell wall biosynthesis